jgi:mono/diheme cytochrome c family protein
MRKIGARIASINGPNQQVKFQQEPGMTNTIRSFATFAVVASFACAGFAQSSGEGVYKQKCLNCHGSTGLANSGIGKIMKVKPVTDPDVMKMTEPVMVQMVRIGMGKMQPYKGDLTDAQIKDSVDYFRTFMK